MESVAEKGTFVLGDGQVHQLGIAIRRNNGGTTDVQWLCAGNNFEKVKLLASGKMVLANPGIVSWTGREEWPVLPVQIFDINAPSGRLVDGVLNPLPEHTTYVDYDCSFNELVCANGCEVLGINGSTFQTNIYGRSRRSFELVKFHTGFGKKDVFKKFAELGLRTANVIELLSFIPKLRETRQTLTIIALGSETTITRSWVLKRRFFSDKVKKEVLPNMHPLLNWSGKGSNPSLRPTSSDGAGWWDDVLVLGVHL